MNEAILPAPRSQTFTIPGAPVQWMRARKNGKRHYTAPRQADYQEAVQWQAKAAHVTMMQGAVIARLTFFMPIPKSRSKRQFAAMLGQYAHDCPTDVDNLAKGILDALNGIAYADDRQVADMHAKKVWSDVPCAVVTLECAA